MFDWVKNNRKPLLLIAISALSIGIATTIVLMKRKDRGFMQRACVEGKSVKDSTKWGAHDFPLTVALDSLASEEWGTVTATAARHWNARTGLTLFAEPTFLIGNAAARTSCGEPGKPADPIIFVTRSNSDGSNTDGNSHAHLFYDSACRIRCVEIILPGLAPKEWWQKIAMHELGHSVGLEHDDLENSVMYYGGRALRWGMKEITAADTKRLREAYR